MISDKAQEALRAEADRIEEDCLYSAKGHFESARVWARWNLRIGIPAALGAAAAGVSGFSDRPVLAGALAVFSGAAAALLTFLKPAERASAHQRAGAAYNSMKNRVRFFRQVGLTIDPDPVHLRERLREIAENRNALGEASPEILRPAFESARLGIEQGEASYRVDKYNKP